MSYLLSAFGIILVIWGTTLTTGVLFLFIFLRARFDDEMISADDESFSFEQEPGPNS